MSDHELRALERRWLESGAVEEEVALLRALRRVERLSDEQLELAAYLGHPAAVQVLGADETARRAADRQARWALEAIEDATDRRDLEGHRRMREEAIGAEAAAVEVANEAWALGLGGFGLEVSVRMGVAAAQHVRAAWEPTGDEPAWRTRALEQFQALRAWLRCPCEEHVAAVSEAAAGHFLGPPGPQLFFGGPCGTTAEIVTDYQDDPDGAPVPASEVVHKACSILAGESGGLRRADYSRQFEELRRVLQAALVPWALDRGDPLLDDDAGPGGDAPHAQERTR